MKKTLLLALCTLTLGACTSVHNTNGVFLKPDDVAKLSTGASRADVLRTLGTPSTTAVFDEDTWYYVGQKTKKDAFFDPEVTERRVYKLTFAEDGTLATINKVDTAALNVPIVSRKTPTSGHDLTVAQQLLGNLGRFNKSSTHAPTDAY